jgi:3-deoxy-D-manno-octulosonic-acid transferase
MLLTLYLFFAQFSLPLWRFFLKIRVNALKEDGRRYREKLGEISVDRPAGIVLWFHALSVGECLALMSLLRRLGLLMPDAHFVLTTNTLTSLRAIEKIGLPPRVIHQFLPADSRQPVHSFLNHWKPSLVAVAELDLWPYVLTQVKRRSIPLVLINGRVTDRTYKKHFEKNKFIRSVLCLFDLYLIQDHVSTKRIIKLGAPPQLVKMVGPLKVGADPLPDFPKERIEFEISVHSRPIWLAASTHLSEEIDIFEAHKMARELLPDLLLIIVPRNIEGVSFTQANAQEKFSNIVIRSSGNIPNADTEVYIADTLGEMGLWLRVSQLTFIGHSMAVPGQNLTGKNPFEALALDQLVLHGPNFKNFDEIYSMLLKRKASKCILTTADLAQTIVYAIKNSDFKKDYILTARAIRREGEKSIEQTAEILMMRALKSPP